MSVKEVLDRWTVQKSADLYGIQNWGQTYYDIDSEGNVVVRVTIGDRAVSVSLPEIIRGIRERGMDMPVLLRVENILDSQIWHLHNAFKKAVGTFGYRGAYRGVFPIKVNQQQQVIEEISRYGAKFHHGLEAGSKSELIAAVSMLKDPEACLICNGYKDEEFIDLGLFAQQLGLKCFFVVEMPGEAELIVQRARLYDIQPLIGVRIKLATKANGHWSESGGDRSIFGLSISQIIDLVDYLREEDMLGSLQLVHYHLGSQISNIRDIRSAVIEAARVYADLAKEGAPMGYIDLGGGLAVDYDGSRTNYHNSMNYTLDEYCADIIENIMYVLDEDNIPHPTIITESGRATVAYSSVLLFNVLDISSFTPEPLPESLPSDSHEQLQNIWHVLRSLSLKNIQECYNDAIYYRDEIRELFKRGDISMRERSLAEKVFWHIIWNISRDKNKLKHISPELERIDAAISDIYYCNFSVFQSLPDSWAIGHLFPVMPVHRLNERPVNNGVIADITCDCDGKIDKFIDLHDVRYSLPLHDLNSNEYYLGVFLVGAYQETLGDLHNLFGDTHVVSIRLTEDGRFEFTREIEGDSVADVLSYVEYDPKVLKVQIRTLAEKAVQQGRISPTERRKIMRAFENGLQGYTYFEK